MDIYVLHDGKEIGPLSAEKTWLLLNQGSIATDDLAWSPGMAKWEALSGILPPAEELQASSEPAPAPPPIENTPLEVSSAKQRALLAFLHIGFTRSTSRQEAALLISDALENPAYATRFAQWPAERLKLHGDLFVAELQARRENRAHHYQSLTQTEGAALFNGVSKAHAQSVITHLDLEHPSWEANESTAARDYFFPTLAEKFPQLVRPEAQGRLKLPAAAGGPSEDSAPPPRKKPRDSEGRAGLPFAAITRGLFFGALLVGIGWFVMKVLDDGKSPAPAPSSAAATSTPAPVESTPAPPAEPTPAPSTPTPVAETAPAAEPMPATPAPMADSAPPPAPTTPAPAPSETPAATPAPAALVLTKPVAVQLTYGSLTLPAGTALRLVAPEGALLRVQYLNNVFTVPASSTNYTGAPAGMPGM